MKLKKGIAASYPKWMYRLALSTGIFILLVPILPTVLGSTWHIAWYVCFGLLSLPGLIGAVCFRQFRVMVIGSSKITYYIDGDKGAHYVCIAGAVAVGVFSVFAKFAECAVFEKAGWSFDDVLFFVPYLAIMAGFLGVGHKVKRKVKVGKFDSAAKQMEIMCSGRVVRFWLSSVSGEEILYADGAGQIPKKEQESMEAAVREVIDAYTNLRLIT